MSYLPSKLPTQLTVGIVHLGLGAFHRAHQAVYTEDAIVSEPGNWGICAVAMRSRELANVMQQRDGRYSLIEQQSAGPVLRELSVIREVLCLPDTPDAVATRIADPDVHVVTVTVTEKGYCFSGADRTLNIDDPLIVRDLANSTQPATMPGILVRGLQLRQIAGGRGLSILSCDNLPANGRLLQRIVLAYAALIDEELVNWIADQCRFPDSMVDRITPASNATTLALAQKLLGEPDLAAIETEPFSQWVIEDNFAGPRPAWEKAGAMLVEEVAPFEDMKLRMLNGAHSLIAYLGAVTGLAAVRDVMAVPAYRALVDWHMSDASETLEEMNADDAARYKDNLLARFENTAIDHRCLQIAMDGSQKLPQRIFIPAMQRLEQGKSVDTSALATALWFRYIQGMNQNGDIIECNDPLKAELEQIINSDRSATERVAALGGLPGVPSGLFDNIIWVEKVASLVDGLTVDGALRTLSQMSAARQ
ncbi:mannitol dehydrogenase family protein [Granulosicoccus antarcticus]|uniref:Polyol:NADP oxidoreductase n=1 Tax=Granulosicoccus antarcticus IMCC3135 TaxID=1192854 RepID=A0A2Z2NL48_9GAMM|nr:mannitol dehydrogenase family protein [Granulosicoccus antarcticus]ASJ71869.1 Polyol:NADP oxidoreductase [Granulosicoccus antarcticus IMCC3135]